LQGDANPLFDFMIVRPAPLSAQYFNIASRCGQEPFNDLNGRGFASTIRSQKAKTLTDVNGQVESPDGLDRWTAIIPFEQLGAADGEHHEGSL
jgi:hypothetical protein